MKLVDWDKVKISYDKQVSGTITEPIYNIKVEAPTVEAIPITDFFRMISNVKLDCDDDIKFSSEYFDGYGDGTRNAVVEMVQALCGDCDGDCDEFWKKYLLWEKENGSNR